MNKNKFLENWFTEQINKLSSEVKKNFDTLWEVTCNYGLQSEVMEWTKRDFDSNEISDFEERFMRAVHYAMDEWDL